MQVMFDYDYPGNIRELENAIEHSFVLCKGRFIEPHHLPVRFTEHKVDQSKINEDKVKDRLQLMPREQMESQLIRETLTKHSGNKVKVAEELNMHRSTLWRKMQRYQISLDQLH